MNISMLVFFYMKIKKNYLYRETYYFVHILEIKKKSIYKQVKSGRERIIAAYKTYFFFLTAIFTSIPRQLFV